MKKHELIRHIEAQGCRLFRDRGKHTIYVNPANNLRNSSKARDQ